MINQVKIQTRLSVWDRFIILQESTAAKGMLFVYLVLLIPFGVDVFQGDVNYLLYKFGEIKEVSGYIESEVPTPYRDSDGGNIYHYYYVFEMDGETHYGDSYSSSIFSIDNTKVIEVLPGFGNISRLYDSTNAPYDGVILLFGLLLVLLFLIVLRNPYIKMKYIYKLLKNAYIIQAKLVSSEPYVEQSSDEYTGETYSNTAMYTMTYEYIWNGKAKLTSADVIDRHLFQDETDLLISTTNPEWVVLVNCLPKRVAIKIRKMKKESGLSEA